MLNQPIILSQPFNKRIYVEMTVLSGECTCLDFMDLDMIQAFESYTCRVEAASMKPDCYYTT